ncbi:MAG: hypothetical protein LC624_11730, partial [Halobacteriales archaeon]|nr:hypothetical protein [Halobacteriales archaeon]
MPDASADCGRPTRNGPCRARPFHGSQSGACYRHGGLGATPRQRTAQRKNAVQHGYYEQALFLTREQRALLQAARGVHDPDLLDEEELGMAQATMRSTFAHEGRQGSKPCAAGNRAFNSALRVAGSLIRPRGAQAAGVLHGLLHVRLRGVRRAHI